MFSEIHQRPSQVKTSTGSTKLQIQQESNNFGPGPPTSYNPESMVMNKYEDKKDLLKVDIKIQLGEVNIDTMPLYVLVFKT